MTPAQFYIKVNKLCHILDELNAYWRSKPYWALGC